MVLRDREKEREKKTKKFLSFFELYVGKFFLFFSFWLRYICVAFATSIPLNDSRFFFSCLPFARRVHIIFLHSYFSFGGTIRWDYDLRPASVHFIGTKSHILDQSEIFNIVGHIICVWDPRKTCEFIRNARFTMYTYQKKGGRDMKHIYIWFFMSHALANDKVSL